MDRRIIIPSSFKEIKQATSAITLLLKDAKADEADIFDIRLSMEEVLINAIKYGNKLDDRRKVYIDASISDNKATITIEDEGEGFDHSDLPDPTKEENLLKPRGRGVFLIKHLMDDVQYNRKGNRVSITKYLRKGHLNQQNVG